MLKNLTISLISYGKVETTFSRAKELRSFAEPIITLAKYGATTHKLRLIQRKLGHVVEVEKIFAIAARFINRAGGYTKIVKNGNRYGDAAPTAVVELLKD